MNRIIVSSWLVAAALAGCVEGPGAVPLPEVEPLVGGPLPEPPLLRPDVHLIQNDPVTLTQTFLAPHIPPLRTTSDSRVAVDLIKSNGGNSVGFYLFTPEKLTSHWLTSPDGVNVLWRNTPYNKPRDLFYQGGYAPTAGGNLSTTDHRTICDGWPVAGKPANPYPCTGNDVGKDCYDITVVSTVRLANEQVQLHGKPIRVKVASPKLATASIAEIVTDPVVLGVTDAVSGPVLPGKFGLEPTITADGHLLVMRIGDTTYGNGAVNPPWTNPLTGQQRSGIFDIMYSSYDAASPPCDVTRWSALHPITHAYWDTAPGGTAGRYGFASYRLRDSKGALYGDGVDFGGSYPWIDSKGANLFFTLISSTLFHGDNTFGQVPEVLRKRFRDTCLTGGNACDPTVIDGPAVPPDLAIKDVENDEQFRGFAFAGLWSRGKVVMLDNLANNTDYGLGSGDADQRMLSLYNGLDVRVGAGRDNDDADAPAGAVRNTSFLDSWQNHFNHDPDVTPATVRDVVWILSTGKATTEVAFDDYLDADAIIVSEMTGATSKAHPDWYDASGALIATNQPTYLDGFVQYGDHRATYVGEVEIANAATSTQWAVPASGRGLGGPSPFPRIEPVAMGGVVGKGLWLHGADQGLAYTIPVQPALPAATTLGLFVDPRFANDGAARALLTFPDGTEVDLIGLGAIRYRKGGYSTTVSLAARPLLASTWTHLGWVVSSGGSKITLYLDGYPFATTVVPAPTTLFGLMSLATSGDLVIGRRNGATSFRGWLDEVKVFARDVGPEVACNQARGTLIELTSQASDPTWWGLAGVYPSHAALQAALGTAATTRYACFHDHAAPDRALLRTLPGTVRSVRNDLILTDELHAYQPRPASDTNPFCLGCHRTGQPTSLALDALYLDNQGPMGLPRPAMFDPRRQPMQTPPRMYGNVPANYLPAGNPAFSDGRRIDPYVIP